MRSETVVVVVAFLRHSGLSVRAMVLLAMASCWVAMGCAAGQGQEPDPAVDDPAELHPCVERSIGDDYWNCGRCARACDPTESDRCERGECRCGKGAPCGTGADCRFGACVDTDPTGTTCEFDGQCASGHACIEGRCSFVRCDEEACDGLDNDCDGMIDESEAGGPLSDWCGLEDGAPLPPPCQIGVRVCSSGAWTECTGEVTPRPEAGRLRCNGVDDDCDGCVDGSSSDTGCVSERSGEFDVLYLIDTSGSMQNFIDAVKEATLGFSGRFVDDDGLRFGIVEVPSASDTNDTPGVHTDLSDFATFSDALALLDAAEFEREPQLDAVYEVATGELPLDWRDGSARILVLFTDEAAQSYRTDHGLAAVGEEEMCDALRHGEVLAVANHPQHYDGFDLCAQLIELGEADVMKEELDGVISDPCDP